MLMTFKWGLLLGLSIIISIGIQNLFVIKQGLKAEYAYWCAFLCFLCDTILILVSITSVNALIAKIPTCKLLLLAFGSLFLGIYGCKAIRNTLNTEILKNRLLSLNDNQDNFRLIQLTLLAISFSLINPQAILDTMLIIGSSANHFTHQLKYLFALGAITASFIWFFGVATLTKLVAHRLVNIKFWQTLEGFSGIMMLGFSVKFLLDIIK